MSTPNPNKIIHVEIVDAVGDGGTFYGDHVVTGDPFIDPPPNWEYGQLLFDGYDEDPTGGSSGGGAGPHDHDEYLPLTGGTLTGDLTVDGSLFLEGASKSKIANDTTAGRERFSLLGATSITTGAALRLYGDGDSTTSAGRVQFVTGGVERMRITQGGRVTVHGDLQVDGVIIGGGLFHIEEGTDTADVLDRAETATMPALDDEGVATADVDSITVNEVVTALLAKVKELSAEIEELKGN